MYKFWQFQSKIGQNWSKICIGIQYLLSDLNRTDFVNWIRTELLTIQFVKTNGLSLVHWSNKFTFQKSTHRSQVVPSHCYGDNKCLWQYWSAQVRWTSKNDHRFVEKKIDSLHQSCNHLVVGRRGLMVRALSPNSRR